MGKGRLEAFTDGVIAIILTIMVLEIQAPQGATWVALRGEVPILLAYVLSFVNVAIFWNNHHHMLHATDRIDGRVLWANMGLLFWMSLVPLSIRWMGDTHFAAVPVATYGIVLAGCAITYMLLEHRIILANGKDNSKLAQAVGKEKKGKISLLFYVLAIPLAFIHPGIAVGLYVLVAMIWFVPDKRIEAIL
jgi:uncharacterized membrane protein